MVSIFPPIYRLPSIMVLVFGLWLAIFEPITSVLLTFFKVTFCDFLWWFLGHKHYDIYLCPVLVGLCHWYISVFHYFFFNKYLKSSVAVVGQSTFLYHTFLVLFSILVEEGNILCCLIMVSLVYIDFWYFPSYLLTEWYD